MGTHDDELPPRGSGRQRSRPDLCDEEDLTEVTLRAYRGNPIAQKVKEIEADMGTLQKSVTELEGQWTFRNNNSGSSTTTFMGITVAAGKTAIIRMNSSATGERVTADT